MTFSEERINEISIDLSDEWQWISANEILVKFYGLEDYAERFWQRKENCPDGWIDCYAVIVVGREIYVRYVEFILVTNNDTPDKYLQIDSFNDKEERLIAKKLFETSNNGLHEMLTESLR